MRGAPRHPLARLLLVLSLSAVSGSSMPKVKAIFSDLDGTLVHFPAWFEEHGSKIVNRDPRLIRGLRCWQSAALGVYLLYCTSSSTDLPYEAHVQRWSAWS